MLVGCPCQCSWCLGSSNEFVIVLYKYIYIQGDLAFLEVTYKKSDSQLKDDEKLEDESNGDVLKIFT